jgi:hypothetical protein
MFADSEKDGPSISELKENWHYPYCKNQEH